MSRPEDSAARVPFVRWTIAIAAIAVVSAAFANVYFALRDPLELEVREGTVWLHVLAQSAGVSLYDARRVAFLNMNHGPLDPLLKAWLHAALPFAPAAVVTRFFAGLLPVALAVLFWSKQRGLAAAALWGGSVYLFLLGLGPVQFLIGRSDPAALSFVCLLLWAGARKTPADVADTRPLVRGAALGGLAVVIGLLNWRYTPIAAGIVAVFGYERMAGATAGKRLTADLAFFASAVVGAGAVWGAVFVGVFHADWPLYYRHFFGVFTRASGWGTMGRMPFELLPLELRDGRWLVHLAIFAAMIAAVRTATATPRRILAAWFAMLTVAWVALAWGYALNHGAGGLHYFAPCYVVLAFALARRAEWHSFRAATALAFMLVCLAGLPWVGVWQQAHRLAATASEAREFLTRVEQRTAGAPIYSEDVHLYEKSYDGRAIDIGDMVAQVAATGYMGAEFSQTVERQEATLRRDPPAYVIVAAENVISPSLRDLLHRRYRAELRSPSLILAQGGLPLTLYRRVR